MLALGLALGAALAWGASDFLGGLTTRGVAVLAVLLVSQVFGGVLVAAVVVTRSEPLLEYAELGFGVLAGLALAVGLGALYKGMAIGVMSVVSPISATGVAIPIAYGLARGERPSVLQAIGVALALVGVVLVSRRGSPDALGSRLVAGFGLAVLSAVGLGTFFVGIDLAAEGGVLWATLAQRVGVVTAVLVALLATRPALGLSRGVMPALLAIGALDLGATALFAAATQEGLTSLVSVIAALYPVTTVALAFAVLGERLERPQGVGAAGALAGVALIAGG
ncbi:MAG TPA: EamA family transporter [Gaiellaceae bacterium]|nr:EamA family transporter [Gaiellaceae bacterium]